MQARIAPPSDSGDDLEADVLRMLGRGEKTAAVKLYLDHGLPTPREEQSAVAGAAAHVQEKAIALPSGMAWEGRLTCCERFS